MLKEMLRKIINCEIIRSIPHPYNKNLGIILCVGTFNERGASAMSKMIKHVRVFCGFIAFVSILLAGETYAQSYFFYSLSADPWTFIRRDSDGTNPLIIYTPETAVVYASAADGSISKAYVNEQVGNDAAIYAMNYDGTGKTSIVSSGTARISSAAAGSGYVWYAYADSPWSVHRVDSDGTNGIQVYLNPTDGIVQEIAFDPGNSKFYFYENDYDGDGNNRIVRTDPDGTSLTVIYNNCHTLSGIAAAGMYITRVITNCIA